MRFRIIPTLMIGMTLFLPLWGYAGTLIVTYQTGPTGERLDRVRFLLKDEQQRQQMYPKGDAYVEDPTEPSRVVAIENLPPGDYNLQFIVPNRDGLFEKTPEHHFKMTAREVRKINQVIKIRYASLEASGQIDNAVISCNLSLEDQNGHRCASTNEGRLESNRLLPGTYKLIFAPMPNYRTPAPIQITLSPGEKAGPFVGTYLPEF